MTLTALAPAPVSGGGRLVLAYSRVSKFKARDVDAEITRGVDRQGDDAETIAEARDLGPVTHLKDNGFSASRFATKERDGWNELLELIRAGRVSVVLIWILDRIIRQTRDLDDLLEACRENGTVILQTASGSLVNPDDPDSVAMAKIAGVLAETEVAKMSKRQIRKQQALAADGQFHGGRRRFGYEPGMAAIRESEAFYVRELAARILAGDSLKAIARDWNAAGVLTSTGKAWRSENLRLMILGAHHAGLRTYKGEIVGDAKWGAKGILDRGQWEAVKGVLLAPDRGHGKSNTRRYLLTGYGRCGVCNGRIRGRMGKNQTPIYQCETTAHVHRSAALVDAIVSATVGAWLENADTDGSFFSPDEGANAAALTAEADELHAHRRDLGAKLGRRELSAVVAAAADAEIESRLAEINAAQKRLAMPPAIVAGMIGEPDAGARFDALPLDRKRAVLAIMPGTFVLDRAAHRGARFDPKSVRVEWDRG